MGFDYFVSLSETTEVDVSALSHACSHIFGLSKSAVH